jgi:hypothetical protein
LRTPCVFMYKPLRDSSGSSLSVPMALSEHLILADHRHFVNPQRPHCLYNRLCNLLSQASSMATELVMQVYQRSLTIYPMPQEVLDNPAKLFVQSQVFHCFNPPAHMKRDSAFTVGIIPICTNLISIAHLVPYSPLSFFTFKTFRYVLVIFT